MKRKLGRGKKRGLLRRDNSGRVLVIVALAAVVLIGMVSLAVESVTGWWYGTNSRVRRMHPRWPERCPCLPPPRGPTGTVRKGQHPVSSHRTN